MKSPFAQKTRLVFLLLLLQAAVLCDLSFATGSDGFQALHVFDGRDYDYFAQGDQVDSGVIIGSDGKVYGTTADTLYTLHGTIYSLNTDGTAFSRVTFVPDGFPVSSGLVEASNGMMYGTTKFGGLLPVDATGGGTIFAFSPVDGTVETIHVFVQAAEGANPTGPLYADDDGWLYGVTNMGGDGGRGVVYGFKPADGQFKVLHSFGDLDAGGFPSTGVTKGSDGRLYGVAAGGEHSDGIFFGIGTDGSGFEILRHFRGSDGSRPLGRPLQTADGTFYGSTFYGGTGGGVIYAIQPDGSGFRVVHNFDYISEGAAPMGALLVGSDGRFYGAASAEGPTGYGTIYSVNPDGSDFKVLHAFDGLHGMIRGHR